jgi:phage/plasmid-like protein (TIGR03299 family)
MAHEVETMFFVGETPWHNVGKRVIEAPTSEEAIKQAELNWQVQKVPLITADGSNRPVDHFAIERLTDKSILGVVGPRFEPLQNNESFKFFDPFIEAGMATYETAGSLRGGKRVFILAALKRDPIVVKPGDEVKKYVLLSNSHDGSLAVRVGFTPIRVVCANTLKMAHDNASSRLLRVRHTASMKDTLVKIQEIMNIADANFQATAEQYKVLANKVINSAQLDEFIKIVFKGKDTPQFETMKNKIVNLFEHGKGADLSKGTAWGAYNAVTEFLGYEAGRNQDNRLNSLWFGVGDTLNETAFKEALKLAA